MQGNCSIPRPAASKDYDKYVDIGAIGSNACSILSSSIAFESEYNVNQDNPSVAVCGRVWLSNLVISSTPGGNYAPHGISVFKVELHLVNTIIAGFEPAVFSSFGSLYVIGASSHHLLHAAYKFPGYSHRSLIL